MSEETLNVEFTAEEARVLLEMINIAVKTVGLDAAESGIYFRKKLLDAAKQAEVPVKQAEAKPVPVKKDKTQNS